MNEFTKTIAFAGSAIVLAGAATISHFVNQPSNSADFELIGQPFFEDFQSADQAKSLEVAAVDEETGELKRFSVANQDGLWRIPSHYDYPAEAAARLATTAASVMGIARDSLEGRGQSEHERLGVVDPLSEEIEDPTTVGKRITIKDGSGEPVVDYIIGNVAEEDVVLDQDEQAFGNPRGEKYYYVRRPDESQTYKVRLAIDLSTKFSDWIEPDLLRLDGANLTKLAIDNYSLEQVNTDALLGPSRMVKKQGDQLLLSRASAADKWLLDSLSKGEEELQQTTIEDMLSTLKELRIVGVRPKTTFKGKPLLTGDLKLNRQPEFEAAPQEFGAAMMKLQAELSGRGFNLAGNAAQLELVSQFGDLQVGTDQGVVYTLQFGKDVEGDDSEIELGIGSDSSLSDAEKASDDQTADEAKGTDIAGTDGSEATGSEDQGPAETVAKNRYLMIRVGFDETLIGERPDKPIEPKAPVAPEGYEPPPSERGDEPAAEKAEEEAPEDVEPPAGAEVDERKPEYVAHDAAVAAYEQAKIDYGVALTKYETDVKAFEEQVKLGKARVDELNERFADWYYVISAENLSDLRVERSDLVKPIERAEPVGGRGETTPPVAPPRPDISFPDLPSSDEGIEPMEDEGKTANETLGENAEVTAPKPTNKASEADKTDPDSKSKPK